MFNLLIIINLLNFYKIGRIQDPIKTIAQNFTIFYYFCIPLKFTRSQEEKTSD